jgi:hypothetical protein
MDCYYPVREVGIVPIYEGIEEEISSKKFNIYIQDWINTFVQTGRGNRIQREKSEAASLMNKSK